MLCYSRQIPCYAMLCYSRQIPWSDDAALLAAWRDGRTGFPWIDAVMTQLREEGSIHSIA